MSLRYFLCDDSCVPLDINSLGISWEDEEKLECTNWTYANKRIILIGLSNLLIRLLQDIDNEIYPN